MDKTIPRSVIGGEISKVWMSTGLWAPTLGINSFGTKEIMENKLVNVNTY